MPGVAPLGIHPVLEVGPEEFSSLVVKSEREEKLGVPLLQPCCSGWDFLSFLGFSGQRFHPRAAIPALGIAEIPGRARP